MGRRRCEHVSPTSSPVWDRIERVTRFWRCRVCDMVSHTVGHGCEWDAVRGYLCLRQERREGDMCVCVWLVGWLCEVVVIIDRHSADTDRRWLARPHPRPLRVDCVLPPGGGGGRAVTGGHSAASLKGASWRSLRWSSDGYMKTPAWHGSPWHQRASPCQGHTPPC